MVFVSISWAEELKKKDAVGKADPYFVFRLGNDEKKTHTKDGSNPNFENESFNLDGGSKLVVMHKDSDMGADSVMAFCCIDLNKLEENSNGWFKLYNERGENQGRVLLVIGKNGEPREKPQEREFDSFVDDESKELVHKMNKSAKVKDGLLGAGSVLGGIGAGFLGKKAYDHFNPKEEEKSEEQRQEEQRQNEQQNQQHNQQQNEQNNQQNQQHNASAPQGGSAGNWDGNFKQYQAGQEIEFEGQKYRVLQGHASQSDWAPSVAHSLFQRI